MRRTKTDVKAANQEAMEAEFLQLGSQWVKAASTPKRANKLYDKLYELTRRMRLLPDRGEAILKHITEIAEPEVRVFAAAAILALDERYALRVLRDVATHEKGLVTFTAEMTIREWKAGNLRVYWS